MGSFQSVLTGGVLLKPAVLGLKRLLRFFIPSLGNKIEHVSIGARK